MYSPQTMLYVSKNNCNEAHSSIRKYRAQSTVYRPTYGITHALPPKLSELVISKGGWTLIDHCVFVSEYSSTVLEEVDRHDMEQVIYDYRYASRQCPEYM